MHFVDRKHRIGGFFEQLLRAWKGFHQSAASAKLNPELRLFYRACKRFHQSATSAKLSSILRLFWCTMRCIAHQKRPRSELNLPALARSWNLLQAQTRCAASHPKKDLAQDIICLLSLNHENLYRLLTEKVYHPIKKEINIPLLISFLLRLRQK
jgi:hypothetical protein